MQRRGQGISINVIIIAAIALIVLVILSTLVIRSGGTINTSANVCGASTTAEDCRDITDGCGPGEFEIAKACLGADNQRDPDQVCCSGS